MASESSFDVVTFTIGLIALMQFGVWRREREPGMAWFATGSLLTALFVVVGALVRTPGGLPDTASLIAMYFIRWLFAMGMTGFLGLTGPTRTILVAVLTLPGALIATALLAGVDAGRLPTLLPFPWCSLGVAILCLSAARRHPGEGHAILALAPLAGLAAGLLQYAQGSTIQLVRNFPAAGIGLGIVVLVASLRRRSLDSLRAQAHAQRMSDYYAALSHANQALLRVHEPDALYIEICRICVDWGRATMACVQLLDGDGMLTRAASAGAAARIMQGFPNPWDTRTPEAAASRTMQALRENRCVVSHDYQADPRSQPWHARAREHQVRTMAWLPLRRGGQPIGVLMLMAGETGFFDDALVKLLDEMANDISFALDNMDREARHRDATRQVEAGLERFSRLFQSAPVASAIISVADQRVVDVNAAMCERHQAGRAQLVGFRADTLAYAPWPEDREFFHQTMRREGRVRNTVARMKDAQGDTHLELLSAEPIDHLGEACYLIMSLDITELRAAEAAREALSEARAASHAKTEFLSRMSHELRTPLNAVLGFTALLERDAAERLRPHEREQLGHVQQAGWHLLRLINDVLDLSRIEAGQFDVDLQAVALAPLLDETLQMSQPLATEFNVSLHVDYARDVPPGAASDAATVALADPTRLRQVLLNVLTNAVKYNRSGGAVRVRMARADARVTIKVEDDGIGMTPHQLAHLFEPFNRLGRDRQGVEGTGIGLALSRQLMQLMDGEIAVRSEPGRGTLVVLTLPCTDEQARTLPAPSRPNGADDTMAPRGTVLCIEDSAVNALLVAQLLARWPDVRVHVAEDGGAGLRMAQALRPDLVLLDMQLPDMDGLDVLRGLRADPQLQNVPVVVLSASAMPESIALARSHGAIDYWTKPLDFQRFPESVAGLLRARVFDSQSLR